MARSWQVIKIPIKWRKFATRRLYDFISWLDTNDSLRFINYGYTSLNGETEILDLTSADERQRTCLQLYHHIASVIPISDLEVLEVGSGRGGGADYILRTFSPQSMVAIDLSKRAIQFCKRYYSTEGLTFSQGDAESLPFTDETFDVVLNVESSLYYPNIDMFFAEVRRVLRPEGHFLYADLRYPSQLEGWRSQIQGMGLEILHEEDITNNIHEALRLDKKQRLNLVHTIAPKILLKSFIRSSGLNPHAEGEKAVDLDGRVYLNFVLQKPKVRPFD